MFIPGKFPPLEEPEAFKIQSTSAPRLEAVDPALAGREGDPPLEEELLLLPAAEETADPATEVA